ncbi:aromatic ring-hydroxylating dioxygenase subunit alpha [Gymnodinialimonas sp. 2305UL16-5]|uniref:aromatic ring-hydroxylating dioxygenase subunit alpha n=1 Tax=Gymnodinialimonas mytili TaxID=3126503 RepID=UPI0030974CF0
MAITQDQIALNHWLPVAYPGQVKTGESYDTQLLGQAIRLSNTNGALSCNILNDGGSLGRDLPLDERFAVLFTTLGDAPRPLPIIDEFDEPDRRIVNCGSVGVNTSPFRIVENFLDMAHFCFVHTDLLGAVDETEVLSYKTEHREDVDEIWATECQFFQPGASASAIDAGAGQMSQYTYRVLSPFSVMLYKSAMGYPDRLDAICLFIQPKTETECIGYMPMALLDDASSTTSMIHFQQTIFMQDRIILENQRPKLLPLTPRAEMPTRADLSSVAFRRWLKDSGMRFGLWQPEAA